MRKIREVLRLRLGHGLPQRAIGQSLRLSQGAVSEYLKRARRAGVGWPLPADMDDVGLEALLFPPPPDVPADLRPMPDWAAVHREMRRQNVTLALLWEEYRAGTADGFGYSWFCDLYREWVGRLKPTLRQVHPAGEKLPGPKLGWDGRHLAPLLSCQMMVFIVGNRLCADTHLKAQSQQWPLDQNRADWNRDTPFRTGSICDSKDSGRLRSW